MGVTIFNDIRMLKQFIYAFRLPIIWICSLGLESCHLDHPCGKSPLTYNKLADFFCQRPGKFVFLYIFLGRFWDARRVYSNPDVS